LSDTRHNNGGRPGRFFGSRRQRRQAGVHSLGLPGYRLKPHPAIGTAGQVCVGQGRGGLIQLVIDVGSQIGVTDVHGFLLLLRPAR
jgi:hypothetical protein